MNNVYNNGIDLSVTVNGRPTRIYTHEGRYFIESREGTEYVIEIKNNNWYRVEAVVAVDGLSVMNGEAASVEDYGYVINGYGSIKIKGYRKSMEEVGAFKFSKRENSYAADKGDSSNVGVIALAVWSEKTPTWNTGTITVSGSSAGQPWSYTPYYTTTTSTPISLTGLSSTSTGSGQIFYTSSNCSVGVTGSTGPSGSEGVPPFGILRSLDVQPTFSHGTTWGKNLDDKVTTTSFTRDQLIAQIEVFYNAKENLEAMGIKLVQEKQVNLPTGFPRSFAAPPKNWNK